MSVYISIRKQLNVKYRSEQNDYLLLLYYLLLKKWLYRVFYNKFFIFDNHFYV